MECLHPKLLNTTSYNRGCRCGRCLRGAPQYRVAGIVSQCERDGCTASRAKSSHYCAEHTNRKKRKPPSGPRVLALAPCEACGRDHGWYESQLVPLTPTGREVSRRVCQPCRTRYMGAIRSHNLTVEWAIRLITTKCCDGCGDRFRIDNHGRCESAVDHDHACCPTTPSCGWCVRGILCSECNRTAGMIEGPRHAAMLTYLDRTKIALPEPSLDIEAVFARLWADRS